MIKPIETHYAGCWFRSRLEARWAVFFDALKIEWQYEPQGFLINRPGLGEQTPYLPDFLLPDCGTWIEVKGHESGLDLPLLFDASAQLSGLMLLGPIPRPGRLVEWNCSLHYDWGWPVLDRGPIPEPYPVDWSRYSTGAFSYFGFGAYHKNGRPWYLDNAHYDAYRHDPVTFEIPADRPLIPVADSSETIDARAYTAARSARFEHGERG